MVSRLKCIRAYLANLGYQAYLGVNALGHVWLNLYFNIQLQPDDFTCGASVQRCITYEQRSIQRKHDVEQYVEHKVEHYNLKDCYR